MPKLQTEPLILRTFTAHTRPGLFIEVRNTEYSRLGIKAGWGDLTSATGYETSSIRKSTEAETRPASVVALRKKPGATFCGEYTRSALKGLGGDYVVFIKGVQAYTAAVWNCIRPVQYPCMRSLDGGSCGGPSLP